MTRVKICGMTRAEDLQGALDLGADAVGFVVQIPGSRRSLTAGAAGSLIRRVPIFVKSVAVIAPTDREEAVHLGRATGADVLQVHTSLPPEEMARLREDVCQKVVAAVPALPGALERALELSESVDAILLDTYRAGTLGGTGEVHDWSVSARVVEQLDLPVILAGGLHPGNVRQAVEMVRPYAVAVASGVESDGRKDPSKVRSFIQEVRRCPTN
ncbi:MAG: phosphoribosylanthranilate isomerase [Methanosarcinales archaeon]|nr:phosphoribosylanthranilate isomerase [Methanosarcinales archaeon]